MIRDIDINVLARQAGSDLDIKITRQGAVLFEVHQDKWFKPLSLIELEQEVMRTFQISLRKQLDDIKIGERR